MYEVPVTVENSEAQCTLYLLYIYLRLTTPLLYKYLVLVAPPLRSLPILADGADKLALREGHMTANHAFP